MVYYILIDAATGQPVDYYFRRVGIKEIKDFRYNKANGWDFTWERLYKEGAEIFALITDQHPEPPVQGLIALKCYPDELYLEILNISSAPNNKERIKEKTNLHRTYKGIGKCLVAFGCQYSIEQGYDGYVNLKSKTPTIPFYLKIPGAKNPGGGQLITFDEHAAKNLCSTFFKGGIKWR